MKDLKNSNINSLEVILTQAPDPNLGLERRQVPRMSLGSEQFKMIDTGRVFSVADLSRTGLALWTSDASELAEFSVGMKLDGTLKARAEKLSVQIQIRNLSKNRVGCEFLGVSSALTEACERFFDPVSLGQSLKPIPSLDGHMLWYFGISGTHLSLRRLNDGQFDQVTLCFLDSLVQWDAERGLQSGRLVNPDWQSELRGIFRLDTLFFKPDSSMDKERLGIAKQVLLNSHLSEDVKGWGMRQFSR